MLLKRIKIPIKVEVQGKEFTSISKAAKFYGKDPRITANRISKMDWTIEEALGITKRDGYRGEITLFDNQFPTQIAAAKFYGINERTFKRWVASDKDIEKQIKRKLAKQTLSKLSN